MNMNLDNKSEKSIYTLLSNTQSNLIYEVLIPKILKGRRLEIKDKLNFNESL